MREPIIEWKAALLNDKLKKAGTRVRIMFPERQPLFDPPYVPAFFPDMEASDLRLLLITAGGDFKKCSDNQEAFQQLKEVERCTPPDDPDHLDVFDLFYATVLELGKPPTKERELDQYKRSLEQNLRKRNVSEPDYNKLVFGKFPWISPGSSKGLSD